MPAAATALWRLPHCAYGIYTAVQVLLAAAWGRRRFCRGQSGRGRPELAARFSSQHRAQLHSWLEQGLHISLAHEVLQGRQRKKLNSLYQHPRLPPAADCIAGSPWHCRTAAACLASTNSWCRVWRDALSAVMDNSFTSEGLLMC